MLEELSLISQEAEPGISLHVLQDDHPPAPLPVATGLPGLFVPRIVLLGIEKLEFALLAAIHPATPPNFQGTFHGQDSSATPALAGASLGSVGC